MSTPNNNIEIFDLQGEVFPSVSSKNVKTTDFDFYFQNGDILNYLMEPPQEVQQQVVVGVPPRRRIFLID